MGCETAFFVYGIIGIVGFRVFWFLLDKSIEKEAERKKAEAAKKAAEFEQKKKEREFKIKELEEKYKDNPITLRAAERFADIFVKGLKYRTADCRIKEFIHIGEVYAERIPCTAKYIIGTPEDQQWYETDTDGSFPVRIFFKRDTDSSKSYSSFFDFKDENLRPLKSLEEVQAFVRATASCAVRMIKEKYPMDESGTKYKMKTEESFSRELGSYDLNHCNCHFTVKFIYTVPNVNYQPPAEW